MAKTKKNKSKSKSKSKKEPKKEPIKEPGNEPKNESRISMLSKRAAKMRGDLSKISKGNTFGTVEDTDQFGYRNKMLLLFTKVLNFLDICLGAVCIAYGVTLYIDGTLEYYGVEFIVLGAILGLSSMLGFFGFASSAAKRAGLLLSSYLGFILGVIELYIATKLAYSEDDFFTFLDENHRYLDLKQSDVDSLHTFFFLVYIGIGLFGVAELVRCFATRRLRTDLISIESIVSARHNASSEPLLANVGGDDPKEEESDSDSDFAPVDGQLYTDGNWWADKNQFEEIAKKENNISDSTAAKDSEGGDIV